MTDTRYDEFIRTRITELRMKRSISEHRMSLELGKSGSYIRGITSGAALPSLKELFNIITYFDMTPVEFFAPIENNDTLYGKLCERLKELDDVDLEKVDTFVDWITKECPEEMMV
ncbi:MAG: helix-turn-helix transcriptional regulator [Eubacteriales bacterium]|nr:helix-turn-helix transcriptional regulator [Eubacteriales bacterium]